MAKKKKTKKKKSAKDKQLQGLEKKMLKMEKSLKQVIKHLNGQITSAKIGGDPFGPNMPKIKEL